MFDAIPWLGGNTMSYTNILINLAKGAGAGVLAITALPVFGAVGAITATGVVVGSLMGAAAGAADGFFNEAGR
jgi:hypothetical protein